MFKGAGSVPEFSVRVNAVPDGIFGLYGKFSVLLEVSATNVCVTLAFTVGADVNPLPALFTVTACITSFRTIGSNSNNDP